MAIDIISTENVAFGTEANPSAQTITVPSDCTMLVVFGSAYGGGFAISSLHFAGALQEYWGRHDSGADSLLVWWAAVYDPATGSQQLDVEFVGTTSAGPLTTVVYLKGANRRSLRDHDARQNSVSGAFNNGPATLYNDSTDVMLVYDVCEDAGEAPPGTPAGWTSLTTQGANDLASRTSWKQGTGPVPTAVESVDGQDQTGRAAMAAVCIPQAGPYVRTGVEGAASGTDDIVTSFAPAWVHNGDLFVCATKHEVVAGAYTTMTDFSNVMPTPWSAATSQQAHSSGDLWTQLFYTFADGQGYADGTNRSNGHYLNDDGWETTAPELRHNNASMIGGRAHCIWVALDKGMSWDTTPLTSVGAADEQGTAITAGTVSSITKPCFAFTFVSEYTFRTSTPGSGWTEFIDVQAVSEYRIHYPGVQASITGDMTVTDTERSLAHMVVFEIDVEVPPPLKAKIRRYNHLLVR